MEKPSCKSCHFWLRLREGEKGICRSVPPCITPDGKSRWPVTRPSDWCGDWEVRK